MQKALTFSDQLRLIDERSTAFRAAVAAAPSLDMQVPTHPERTLFDLVQHVGMGRRKSAAIVAGPADAPPEKSAWEDGMGAPREREALLAWWTESIEQLTSALREAGQDRGCWTWWGDSPSPQTSGAWTRRQVPEIAVPTYDAQLTVGAPQPLPDEVALDGFDDCQFTLCATTVAWPHQPAIVDYHATEGRSWRLRLSRDGARVVRLKIRPAGRRCCSVGRCCESYPRARQIQFVHAVLRNALQHAMREDLVSGNVAKLVRVPSPRYEVQAIDRHADVKITLKVYAHANLDAMRQALGKLDGRLS